MAKNILLSIQSDLKQNADLKTKNSAQSFFKEPVKLYGVKTPIVRKIARKYFHEIKHLTKNEIFSLCEKLLKSDYHEEACIAFDWAYRLSYQYKPQDLKVFENWLNNYVNNWAKCDDFCNHTIGSFIELFPQYIEKLETWTLSKNRWVRRASAVTLILPARKGKFLPEVFRIADSLLFDEDDLVQKGYGWLLKEASRTHEKEVFYYIMKHRQEIPRTALRYAIEKMPQPLRKQAMEKL
jgi:3-methyladenine DNA glycosylase AlkD